MTCSPLCMPLPTSCRFVRSCCMCMHGCGVDAVWRRMGGKTNGVLLASDDARAFATGLMAQSVRLSGRSKTKQNDGLQCCKGLTPNVQSLNSFVFALNPRICSTQFTCILPITTPKYPPTCATLELRCCHWVLPNTTNDCGSFAFSYRSYSQKNTCGSPKGRTT